MASPTAKDPSLDEKPSTSLHDHHHGTTGEKAVLAHAPTHHDPNWAGDGVDFSMVDENKTLRKMDTRLIPVLAILYLLSFLDRGKINNLQTMKWLTRQGNIGNAKIQGLVDDLGLSGHEYNMCLTVFFFTYCAFEIPSNLLLKRFRPSIWLPSIMVAWGTVMTLMGIVQSYHGLLIARLFLGVAEAGLYPGVAYYLTMWYCTKEIQWVSKLVDTVTRGLLNIRSDKDCFSVPPQWQVPFLDYLRMRL
jgi:hypothetical protein